MTKKIQFKKKSITFPFIYLAQDYHEFSVVAETISKLVGRKVSYKEYTEEDFLDSDENFKGMKVVGKGYYVAVMNVRK